jgi:hypothetical protein
MKLIAAPPVSWWKQRRRPSVCYFVSVRDVRLVVLGTIADCIRTCSGTFRDMCWVKLISSGPRVSLNLSEINFTLPRPCRGGGQDAVFLCRVLVPFAQNLLPRRGDEPAAYIGEAVTVILSSATSDGPNLTLGHRNRIGHLSNVSFRQSNGHRTMASIALDQPLSSVYDSRHLRSGLCRNLTHDGR